VPCPCRDQRRGQKNRHQGGLQGIAERFDRRNLN
jgi:hypothetical protein